MVTRKLRGRTAVQNLDLGGMQLRVKKIPITSTPTGAEQDTSFDLPSGAVVRDVLVDVTTAEATGATKTLDVGLLSSESGGDADGLLDGVSVAATGLVRGVATLTVGSNETYFASSTRGALLATLVAGTDVATDVGTNYEVPHLGDSVTAKSVTVEPDFTTVIHTVELQTHDLTCQIFAHIELQRIPPLVKHHPLGLHTVAPEIGVFNGPCLPQIRVHVARNASWHPDQGFNVPWR